MTMGVRRPGDKSGISPLEIESKHQDFLENMKLAAQFRSTDLNICNGTLFAVMTVTLHNSPVHCSGAVSCSGELAVHSCPPGLPDRNKQGRRERSPGHRRSCQVMGAPFDRSPFQTWNWSKVSDFDVQQRESWQKKERLRWRMEFSEFDFDIGYRRSKLNTAPDALSRACCATIAWKYAA